MNKQFLWASLGWGVGLWLIGYVLGFILFAFVPAALLGWVIMPIGVAMTVWVLLRKVRLDSFEAYVYLAITWTAIAVLFDYAFLVKLLKPADGYYKLDVYLYYILTFLLPLIIGWRKKSQIRESV